MHPKTISCFHFPCACCVKARMPPMTRRPSREKKPKYLAPKALKLSGGNTVQNHSCRKSSSIWASHKYLSKAGRPRHDCSTKS